MRVRGRSDLNAGGAGDHVESNSAGRTESWARPSGGNADFRLLSNLFRSEYGDFWRTTVNIAFPNLVHGESRQDIQNLVKPINAFRDRVAHHETVLDMNVTDISAKTVRLLALRCVETAE